MSLETACFSMYSDISKRISALSLPNRKEARLRATSVLPTPVGPRNKNTPTGRVGVFRPARERRVARDDLFDVFFGHRRAGRIVQVVFLAHLPQILALLAFLVAVEPRLLKLVVG